MKYLLMLALLIPALSFSQKNKDNDDDAAIPMVNGQVIYTEVVKVDSSTTAAELYQRAKRFFVSTYKSANDVIQLDDEKNGEITGKGVFKVDYNQGALVGVKPTNVRHSISIFVKDGRYKYEIKDLEVNYYASGQRIGTSYISGHDVKAPFEDYANGKMKVHKRYASAVDAEVKATIDQLKAAMAKVSEAKKSDW